MIVAALEADETLLILKIAFLVVLYGFILLVVRSATRDIGGAPQESIILGAAEAAKLRAELGIRPARLVVLQGPGLAAGSSIEVSSSTIVGRDASVGVRLDGDDFASGRHARLEPGPEGVWVEDLGSTNGTFVNGEKIEGRALLKVGDALQVGETELRLES